VIEAKDLASRDIGSASDPYLRVEIGDQEYNSRDEY